MSDGLDFKAFAKIPRLRREMTITEKIDGTNGHIFVVNSTGLDPVSGGIPKPLTRVGDDYIYAASRNRYVYPGCDNYGFAAWVLEHASALVRLGPGRHFGEWWGAGIQRRYGLDHKRFSLFNLDRWSKLAPEDAVKLLEIKVDIVPPLFVGPYSDVKIDETLALLAQKGSVAAPGFMKPEGVVIRHHASGQLYKVTLANDSAPKTTLT